MSRYLLELRTVLAGIPGMLPPDAVTSLAYDEIKKSHALKTELMFYDRDHEGLEEPKGTVEELQMMVAKYIERQRHELADTIQKQRYKGGHFSILPDYLPAAATPERK